MIYTCQRCGGLLADPQEMFAGRPCCCAIPQTVAATGLAPFPFTPDDTEPDIFDAVAQWRKDHPEELSPPVGVLTTAPGEADLVRAAVVGTPRTDAATHIHGNEFDPLIPTEFARQLERELTASLAGHAIAFESVAAACRERDEARARVVELEGVSSDADLLLGEEWRRSVQAVNGDSEKAREHRIATLVARIAELEADRAWAECRFAEVKEVAV